LEATFDLVKDNYKRLTINARKTRHSLIKDHPNYLKDILLYFRNTEMLIIEGYIAVGGKLGLNTENLQQMERGLK